MQTTGSSLLKKPTVLSLTMYIHQNSPRAKNVPNWLPAPKVPFATYMRLYRPEEVFVEGLLETAFASGWRS